MPFLRARTAAILDEVAARGECDFLVDVAAELPLQTIARILGVPEAGLAPAVRVDVDDPRLPRPRPRGHDRRARERGARDGRVRRRPDRGEARAARPTTCSRRSSTQRSSGDDGEVEALSEGELSAFFSLLFVAGSETTRNSIAGGLLALDRTTRTSSRALQRDRSLLPTAVEEILRWTSATAYNRRTATRDVELGGQLIRAGEKTTHWYPSANRDDAVFDDPFRFDVARDPNPHVAFGGGLHHCLGAALARTEIRVMFEELLDRFTGFELAGPVEWGRSNKHTSIRHLPISLTPR